MKTRYDLAIIGSGFAGSLLAMIACRLGFSVLLLERGRHPRIVIGESSTPLSNLLLEDLANRYDLPMLKPLCKWGTWQQTYPHIGCGLKRGFSFFHHTLDQAGSAAPLEDRQMLVAASPSDTIADTHWYRADVDQLLVEQAQALGATYIDALLLDAPARQPGGWSLTGVSNGQTHELYASFLVDATGPRGFLHRSLALGEQPLPGYPQTSALYSHFSGVAKFSPSAAKPCTESPYPVDAAALHHVFDGGWIWVLRFNNGIISAGVAATARIASRFNFFSDTQEAWARLLRALPEVENQFEHARAEMPFTAVPHLAFRSAATSGAGWALLPAAAGSVDPLLSTGFPLSLFGVTRFAELLERDWLTSRFESNLRDYGMQTQNDLLATARLVSALYRSMNDFPTFRAISLLYFTAASYAESARRLGKTGRASSFLLRDHPSFGPASQELLARVSQTLSSAERSALREDIYTLIEPFDIAGLSARPSNHCYPVRAEDLFQSAHKLGASRQEIEAMLGRSGFYASAT